MNLDTPAQATGRRSPIAGGRLFYGWIQVIALSFTELVSWGIVYYAFSALIVPMSDDLGWSRVQLTGAFSVGVLVSGIAGIPVGRYMDRHGARRVMTAGSIAATGLVLLWASVDTLPVFYLLWIGLGITMAAVLYEPSFMVVATWFRRHRNRALAILTFTGGLASVVFLPLTTWLVERDGWRHALVTLAIILGVATILPHALLLRRRPADHGLRPDGEAAQESVPGSDPVSSVEHVEGHTLHEALRNLTFWWICGSFALIWGCSVAILVHLIPYLQDRGYSAGFAATATGAIGLLKLPGRLVLAPMSERFSARTVALCVFGGHAIAALILAVSDAPIAVYLFVVFFSAGNGALTMMRTVLVANVFGLRAFGGISGTIGLITQGAMAIGPLAVSLLVAQWGGYRPVFWMIFVLLILSCLGIVRVVSTMGTSPDAALI